MFIQVQNTPNPSTLKFLLERNVLKGSVIEFSRSSDFLKNNLVKKIFFISGVKKVFFGKNFISITKELSFNWSDIKFDILKVIKDYFDCNDFISFISVSSNSEKELKKQEKKEADTETVIEIKDLLNTKIRPAVSNDGGDIVFDRFENGVVFVKMKGACHGCPSSSLTLKSGIENMLRYYIPEVVEVRAIED